jgi:hypothetical protein
MLDMMGAGVPVERAPMHTPFSSQETSGLLWDSEFPHAQGRPWSTGAQQRDEAKRTWSPLWLGRTTASSSMASLARKAWSCFRADDHTWDATGRRLQPGHQNCWKCIRMLPELNLTEPQSRPHHPRSGKAGCPALVNSFQPINTNNISFYTLNSIFGSLIVTCPAFRSSDGLQTCLTWSWAQSYVTTMTCLSCGQALQPWWLRHQPSYQALSRTTWQNWDLEIFLERVLY